MTANSFIPFLIFSFRIFSIYFFPALINKCEFNSFSLAWVHTHSLELRCIFKLSHWKSNGVSLIAIRFNMHQAHCTPLQLYILYTIAHICRLFPFFPSLKFSLAVIFNVNYSVYLPTTNPVRFSAWACASLGWCVCAEHNCVRSFHTNFSLVLFPFNLCGK